MMKLNQTQKDNLLQAADQVYKSYVALDFFKTRTFKVEQSQLSLAQICENAIRDGQLKQSITCSGQVFELELTKDALHSYKVSFKRPLLSHAGLRKPLNDYDDNEALALLSQQNFYLDVDKAGKLHVANQINETTTIGGIGKIDLYRSHLVTLHNIIEKISSEEDISNLLVALATGSGKTYVQALWLLVLALSGNNAIFAVPDRLVPQLRDDLKRVLPANLVDDILILREKEACPEAEKVLDNLKTAPQTPRIIIGSSERLLDKHYQQLLEASPEHTFLSFDEQHLLMKSELRRVRLIELSKKMLSMFLTATPSQETYELSGNKPVAIMSSGQKQAAGQGQFPVLFSENARNITDRNALRDYRFWTLAFWKNMLRGILLRFSSAIQQEQSSAAVSIVESLPFYLHRKPGETDVRWSMQVPMARKMLCIIDDNETLVNFCHALESSAYGDRTVYHNGNLIDRRSIVDFFRLPEVDNELISEDLEHRKQEYRQVLNQQESQIGNSVVSKSLKAQIKDNILHNMVEYVLSDLTGLDEIEHNRLRKMDPKGFQNLIQNKLIVRNANYYQEKLEKVIDAQGARKIASILSGISEHLESSRHNNITFNRVVDNWVLDNKILSNLQYNANKCYRNFENYANSHLMISVMTGMQASETPIEESRPFLGLREDRYRMYDNGVLRDTAKRRQHSALETLNDTSMESAFTPTYKDFNEEVCDNYFRLGFVGVYVSNKKTEGFSDRNLHTVINLTENKLSTTNSPETLIQGIGRNRGLDETVVPAYIHALGRQQKTVFDLEHLKSNDYYPELFKAQSSFNQQFIQILGKNVGEEIVYWFRSNVDKDESIDNDKLKKQVLKIIARSLRQLNNNNSHAIQLSRSQLTQVISEAMTTLENHIARINKPYELSLSVRILGSIANFICEIYYSAKRLVPALQRFSNSWFGTRTDFNKSTVSTKHADDVYIKIINKTDFKALVENISVIREFKDWLMRKKAGIKTTLQKDTESYLKDELKNELSKYKVELVEPLFSKFVVADKRKMLSQAIKNMPNFIGFIEKNKDSFTAIWEGSDVAAPEKILQLLQQIPGLDELTAKDVVNYPQQLKTYLASFEQGPLALLRENETLKNGTINNLANYLRGPFLTLSSALFLDADSSILQNILQQEGNAEKFLTHLLDKTKDEMFQITDLRDIITEFKQFFMLENFASLETRATECIESLSKEMDVLGKNPLANLKEEEITKIAKIVKEDLLPCLVNTYPLANRQAMLNAASLDKVKELIKQESQDLMESMGGDESEIASKIFSKLSTTSLPEQLNIRNEASRVQNALKAQFEAVLSTSPLELGVKKIFNPSSWLGTIDSPQYIYDVPVSEVIKGKDFIDGMSLMLSFNEWQDLNGKIKNDSDGTLKLARALIDAQKNGGQDALQPENLIQLINQSYSTAYIGAQALANKAVEKLQEQQESLAQEPVDSLSPEMVTRLAVIVREKLMPLLAAFIKDGVTREYFIKQLPVSDPAIVKFTFMNQEKFASLKNDDVEQEKAIALDLINQLLASEQLLKIEQIIHPANHAESQGKQIIEDLSENVLTSVLTSAYFKEFAEKIFNRQDYSKLLTFLQTKEKIVQLTKKITKIGFDALTQDKLIALLQEDESLKNIQLLNKRLDLFGNFMRQLSQDGLDSLDKHKLSGLTADQLAPVFFHPEFYASLQTIIGSLDKEDLAVIFDAMKEPKAKEQAALIMDFVRIVKTQDKNTLQEKFLTIPGEGKASFDDLPIKKTVELLEKLLEEVMDCQCYYNNHDSKGEQGRSNTPKLCNNMSKGLRDIHVDCDYSFPSGFSRKIFFIQGIRNGLPRCAQVNADSYQSQVKVLERINKHILRPLWWSANLSYIGYAIVKLGRNINFALKAFGFAILNAIKFIPNLISGGYFTIYTRNPISADYNDTAFDVAEKINELVPFDAPKVAEKACPVDVITGVEASIAARRNPAFFTSVDQMVDEKTSHSPQYPNK